jgi:hypothetical protein
MDEARSTPDIQPRPDYPAPAKLPDLPPTPPPVKSVREPAVVIKLRLLARCHEAIARSRTSRLAARFAVGLLGFVLAAGLGLAVAAGVFWIMYDDPERYTQRYRDSFGNFTYFVQSARVDQQTHDYFIKTHNNFVDSQLVSIPSGFGAFALSLFLWWLMTRSLGRSRHDALEAEVQAMCKDHPDVVQSWGGATVLRHQELVEELLKIETAG